MRGGYYGYSKEELAEARGDTGAKIYASFCIVILFALVMALPMLM